jgi:hypothetical protein
MGLPRATLVVRIQGASWKFAWHAVYNGTVV